MQGSGSADIYGISEACAAGIASANFGKYLGLKRFLLTGCALAMSLPAVGGTDAAAQQKPANTAKSTALDPLEQRAVDGLKQMIDDMAYPYDQFTLANGLRVFVVPDSNAATVAVSVWYNVGTKSEPAGRSGFAHLFEHLMFNGSENVPGDYMLPLVEHGAEVNGSTSIDRTNYYEIVTPAAVDRALYMEADRMGHLLGAVSQEVLDEQRGVIQNEKRVNDDSPSSIAHYRIADVLYGPRHPYGHSVIGSMADLRAADLNDVRSWFRDHYGPNNAVLVLSGKITLAEARQKIEKYFGSIPRGPQNVDPVIVPAPMAKTVRETLTAPVENPIIYRVWQVPGAISPESVALDGIMEVMNDQETGLRRRLVEDRQLFNGLTAVNRSSVQAGEFVVSGTVHAGVDPKVAAAALDAEIASYLSAKVDPTTLVRLAAKQVYQTAQSVKRARSRGGMMGEAFMMYGDPLAFRDNLRGYVSLEPDAVLATARKWLLQPHYDLTLVPGPRITPKDDVGADGRVVAGTPPAAAIVRAAPVPATARTRSPAGTSLPIVGTPQDATFPTVQYATLSNGIKVRYAPVSDRLYTTLELSIEGGLLHLPKEKALLLSKTYSQLTEAFAGHDKEWVRRRTDLLGINLIGGVRAGRAAIGVGAPNANLPTALTMLMDALTSPDYPVREIELAKRDILKQPAYFRTSPDWLADMMFKNLVDTGAPMTERQQIVTADDIRSLTRDNLLATYRQMVRPERASLTVVSGKSLAELTPLLEKTLGSWKQTGTPGPLLPLTYTPGPATPQIVIVDMPDAVQATVLAGQWVDMDDRGQNELVFVANRALGGGFTSRINMNLREDKHWVYGASGSFMLGKYGSNYVFQSKIQQDKVGAAIDEVRKEVRDITGSRAISANEFSEIQSSMLGTAASAYEDPNSVMGGLLTATEQDRPDNYPAGMGKRFRDTTLTDANALLRKNLNVDKCIWVIAGNAALIRPQIEKLGLPIKVVKPTDIVPMQTQ